MFDHISAPARSGARRAILASAFIAALVAPIAVAPPAFAAKTVWGCTVTAKAPKYHHMDDSGRKIYDYRVHVKCTKGNRWVIVQQQFWEDDEGWFDDNDYQGKYQHPTRYFKKAGEEYTFHYLKGLANTEKGNEEIFQKARIRVKLEDDVHKWSAWDVGPNTNAPN